MAPSNDQPSRPPLPVRLFMLVAARNPLDMEHCHVDHAPPVRYAYLFSGLFVAYLATLPVIDALRSDQGGAASILSEASSPLLGLFALMALVLVYLIMGGFLARHLNGAVALFVVGVGFSFLSAGMGGIHQFAWSDASPWLLGVETVCWALATFYLVWALNRSSGGLPDVPHDWKTEPIGSWASLSSKPSLSALACSLIVLPVAWVLLADDSHGQVLGAVILASFLAGMAGRVAAPKLDPILIYPGVVLVGGLAQLVVVSGWSGSLADALVEQTVPRFLYVMPITWVAGSLAGVSMGVGWARSFISEPPGTVADN
ncbi:MAG: hypothetical protein MK082_05100 [Phycisphaerales bacterium]|nr:hypothetical protein [Phycisphaerales bacterium]